MTAVISNWLLGWWENGKREAIASGYSSASRFRRSKMPRKKQATVAKRRETCPITKQGRKGEALFCQLPFGHKQEWHWYEGEGPGEGWQLDKTWKRVATATHESPNAAPRYAITVLLRYVKRLERELAEAEASVDLHSQINRDIAEALGHKFGESWHILGEKVRRVVAKGNATTCASCMSTKWTPYCQKHR